MLINDQLMKATAQLKGIKDSRDRSIVVAEFAKFFNQFQVYFSEDAFRKACQPEEADQRDEGVLINYDFEVTHALSGEYEVKPGPDGFHGTPAVSDVPSWLLNLLEIDFFHSAVLVYLYVPRPIDALPLLKRLPRLEEVHFPLRGDADEQNDLDRLRNELPGVNIVSDLAIVG